MKRLICFALIVILVVLSIGGCKEKPKTIKEIKPTTVTVDALWFAQTASGPKGGSSKVEVKLNKQKVKKLRVGFFEEEVSGTGDMWRASGWAAAVTTSLLTGVNLADYEVSYGVEGRIDGPSAGGLMTVATLASLMGEKVKKDATMTGTINIDGSIGPVGGIIQKLGGAKRAKKKLVLVPTGQRFSVDEKTGVSKDVVERGKDLGIKVQLVSNVYDAYRLLVGKSLPKPSAKEIDMELPEASVSKVKAKAKEWYSRYQEKSMLYNNLSATMRTSFNPTVFKLDELAQSANDYYKQGLFATSYGQAVQAAIVMDMIYAAGKTGDAFIAAAPQGQAAALKAARSQASTLIAASGRIDALFDRLKEEKAESLGDVLAISGAYGTLLEGVGFEGIGANQLNAAGGTLEQQLQNAMMGAFFYAVVPLAVEGSEDSLEIGLSNEGKKTKIDNVRVKAMGELIRRAAEANINYFETTVLAEMAKSAGVSEDIFKQSFMNQDLTYTFAKALLNMMPDITKKTGKGVSAGYAMLGASLSSYVYASELNAKYYSLGAKLDKNGNVVGVTNEKALLDMLDYNEERAKENIAVAAKAAGISPFPIIEFETARVAREKDAESKFQALADLWRANLQAQVMTMLSAKLELAASEDKDGEALRYRWK